jgi:hypothetical protein
MDNPGPTMLASVATQGSDADTALLARLIGVRDRADLSNEDELDRVLAIENKSKKL